MPNLSAAILLFAVISTAACGSSGSTGNTQLDNADRPGISNRRSEISNSGSEIRNSVARDPAAARTSAVNTASVNINTASAEELQRLPHVGPLLARKIIEHREKHGPFSRPEGLMLIDGISDSRFRRIRHLIRVE